MVRSGDFLEPGKPADLWVGLSSWLEKPHFKLIHACTIKAIPIKFVVARVPPTQNFQIPVENTKILKHFQLIKLGEIISNFLLKYFHLIRII